MNSNKKTQYMVKVAMLSVISFLLMTLEFPIPFTPPWMKIDLSELPVIFGGYAISPIAGVTISFIKNLLHFLLKNNDGTIVGEIAAFLCGVAFVVPGALIYKKDKKKFVVSLIVGSICMTIAAALLNAYVLLPVYAKVFGMPIEQLIGMASKVNPLIKDLNTIILIGVVPFNVVKCIILVIFAMLLYNRLEKYLTL